MMISRSIACFFLVWASVGYGKCHWQLPCGITEQALPFEVTPIAGLDQLHLPTDFAISPQTEEFFVLQRTGEIIAYHYSGKGTIREKKRVVLPAIKSPFKSTFDESGALGLVLHPNFHKNSKLYVYYTPTFGYDFRIRLSEIDWSKPKPIASERVIFEAIAQHKVHLGGGLDFDDQGFLLAAIGNGTMSLSPTDHSSELLGGIIRLDVDKNPNSILPKTKPTNIIDLDYRIPRTNPFLENKIRDEFWTIGLRNPFRIQFDPKGKRIWLGDVGHITYDEINVSMGGEHFQWPYLEGDKVWRSGRPEFGKWQGPEISLGRDKSFAVIGGVYVNSSNTLPDQTYLFADNVGGNIYGLGNDKRVSLLSKVSGKFNGGITKFDFGTANKGSEVLVSVMGIGPSPDQNKGYIGRLRRNQEIQKKPSPVFLSATDLFDKKKKEFTPRLTSYFPTWSVIRPPFRAEYLIAPLTKDIEMEYLKPKPGTALVKNIYFKDKPIETNVILVTGYQEFETFNYAWNETSSDASLVRTDQQSTFRHKGQEFHHTSISSSSCRSCHFGECNHNLRGCHFHFS